MVLDSTQCPLCGQDNGCQAEAIKRGERSRCWCMDKPISKDALSRIPSALKDKQCLCAVCGKPAPSCN